MTRSTSFSTPHTNWLTRACRRSGVRLIGDLKEMAPLLGFGGYQPLIRSYISEGMRRDEALLDEPSLRSMQDMLQKHGLSDEAISEVVAQTIRKRA